MDQQQPRGTIANYEIYETLGTGATSKVKLAVDTNKNPGDLNYKVAIKIIHSDLDSHFKASILDEIKMMR